MSAPPAHKLTIEEYSARELVREFKQRYGNGYVFGMPEGPPRHSAISANIIGCLVRQLEKHPCQVFTSGMKIVVEATGLITCPDVMVAGNPEQFFDQEKTVLLNPLVLIEVLSKSAESFDRGDKSRQYRLIPSLREYVLVAQDRPQIERYTRQESGDWLLSEASESGQSVRLESIGCELAIDGVYAKIQFADAE